MIKLKIIIEMEGVELINEVSNIRGNTFDQTTEFDLSKKLKKNEMKKLQNAIVQIEITAKACCLCPESSQGILVIELKALATTSEIKNNYTIPGYGEKVEISIKLRTPLVEKEFDTVTHERINVKTIIPSFKEPAKQPTNEQQKKPEEQGKPQQAPEKKIVPVQKVAEPTGAISYDPSEFSAEELKDPDCISNLIALKVIEEKLKVLEKEYSEIEGRPPAEFRTKLMKTRVQKKSLEASMSEGVITMDVYMTKVNMQILHDRKLMQYFKDKADETKAKIVQSRIAIMLSEIKELSS